MGITRQDYIIYGWKLPYDSELDIFSDKFLPYVEGHPGMKYTLVSDDMGGDYQVFGRLIKNADDDGWGFVDLNSNSCDANLEETKDEYRLLFEKDPISDPTLFIFTHYS